MYTQPNLRQMHRLYQGGVFMNLFVLKELCYFSYFDLPITCKLPISVQQGAKALLDMKEYRNNEYLKELTSSKYRNYIIVDFYDDNENTGCVLYRIEYRDQTLVCFRGSESYHKDQQPNGWQDWEDNIDSIFENATPQQLKAMQYLSKLVIHGTLVLCGHSKGGNLAYFGALSLSDEKVKQLTQCVGFNAPGISRGMKRKYTKRIKLLNSKDCVHAIENEFDIVSSLFLSIDQPSYVVSSVPFNGIEDVGAVHMLDAYEENAIGFVYTKQKGTFARSVSFLFNDVIMMLPKEERKQLVKPLYEYFYLDGSYHELCDSIHKAVNHYQKLLDWTKKYEYHFSLKKLTHEALNDILKA